MPPDNLESQLKVILQGKWGQILEVGASPGDKEGSREPRTGQGREFMHQTYGTRFYLAVSQQNFLEQGNHDALIPTYLHCKYSLSQVLRCTKYVLP